jgi:hypothetical protein
VRTALFMAALAHGTGCGTSKDKDKGKGTGDGARCDPAARATVRSRLAAVPEQPATGARGLPARVLNADGARTAGAVRLTYFEDARGDVLARVGDQPPVLAGEAGSSKALQAQLRAALDGAPAQVIEIEAFAELSPIALVPWFTAFDPAVELRLVVEQVKAPPETGVAPWATKLYAGLGALPSEQRAGEIQKGLLRALRGQCFTTLDRALAAQGDLDGAALRNALPETLASCGCKGADLGTATWLYQLLLLRTYEPAWLRLRIDTGGARLSEVRTVQDVARGLAALTPAQRQQGVWIVP